MITQIDLMREDYSKIEGHLKGINDLAEYVKEKDAKSTELFAAISSIDIAPDISNEDIDAEIRSATMVRETILESQAIGYDEIVNKNAKISKITKYIEELGKKRRPERVN